MKNYALICLSIICLVVSGCSAKREPFLDNMPYTQVVDNSTDTEAMTTPQPLIQPRRGLFSRLIGKLFSSTHGVESNSQNSEAVLAVEDAPKTHIARESGAITTVGEANTIPNSRKSHTLIGFFQGFWPGGHHMRSQLTYQVDTLIKRKNLDVVVLKIPDHNYISPGFNDGTLNNEVASRDHFNYNRRLQPSSPQDFMIVATTVNGTSTQSQINNKGGKNIAVTAPATTPQSIFDLQYKAVPINSSSLITSVEQLNALHQRLINQLLAIHRSTYNILYVFYRDTNTYNSVSVTDKVILSSYLTVFRDYVYSKKLPNIYVQEVKLTNVPLNEVMLVVKPITKEVFTKLPKNINIYNATKLNSNEWQQKVDAAHHHMHIHHR